VDEQGDIYLAGKAGEKVAGTDATAKDAVRSNGVCSSRNLQRTAAGIGRGRLRTWARACVSGIRQEYSGRRRVGICVQARWFGQRVDAPAKTKGTKSINPVDWTVASGWDSNTKTGREPWRKPSLRLQFAPETNREDKLLFPWDPK